MNAISVPPIPAEALPAEPRLAALINPRSFRMRLHQRASRTAERVRAHGGRVFEVGGLDDIERSLATAIDEGAERLVIAGGDGTLQATVSWLARELVPENFPELLVLSAGRTNYVAADLGTRRHFVDLLETMLAVEPSSLHPITRHSIACTHPSIGEQHGFFMAGAMIDEIIRLVHQSNARKMQGTVLPYAASTTGVIALMARWALGLHRFTLPRLRIEAAELGSLDSVCRFLLITSLPLTGHLVNPYARRGEGHLRLTTVAQHAKGMVRRLPRLLRGRLTSSMNEINGYLSGCCDSILIHNLNTVTLDGQEFDLDPAEPLRLTTGPAFRFLRP
ncbi:MAG: diacylglycerol kinase family protein [Wenzhouxiangellaceae bacterium]|nr:diacylglycerol kinase family protein [Wenzhouxiangellaceae bacterium]